MPFSKISLVRYRMSPKTVKYVEKNILYIIEQ